MTPKPPKVGDWVWHIHHDILVERLDEPVENRIAFIKAEKPAPEVKTRLRLMKRVRNQRAPASAEKAYDKAVASAGKARDEAVAPAGKAYNEAVASARKAWDEAVAPARKAYDEAVASARKAYNEAVAALHAKECPNCPWNGETIFP